MLRIGLFLDLFLFWPPTKFDNHTNPQSGQVGTSLVASGRTIHNASAYLNCIRASIVRPAVSQSRVAVRSPVGSVDGYC